MSTMRLFYLSSYHQHSTSEWNGRGIIFAMPVFAGSWHVSCGGHPIQNQHCKAMATTTKTQAVYNFILKDHDVLRYSNLHYLNLSTEKKKKGVVDRLAMIEKKFSIIQHIQSNPSPHSYWHPFVTTKSINHTDAHQSSTTYNYFSTSQAVGSSTMSKAWWFGLFAEIFSISWFSVHAKDK